MTDIFQVATILAGIIGMLIKGVIDAGGIENVFKIVGANNRLELWRYLKTNI
jgi:Na+/proline symporter